MSWSSKAQDFDRVTRAACAPASWAKTRALVETGQNPTLSLIIKTVRVFLIQWAHSSSTWIIYLWIIYFIYILLSWLLHFFSCGFFFSLTNSKSVSCPSYKKRDQGGRELFSLWHQGSLKQFNTLALFSRLCEVFLKRKKKQQNWKTFLFNQAFWWIFLMCFYLFWFCFKMLLL